MNLHQVSPAPPHQNLRNRRNRLRAYRATPTCCSRHRRAAAELICIHLAGAIDPLASLLNANPSATNKTCDVLEVSNNDLPRLTQGFERLRAEELEKLEQSLEEQTRGIPQVTRTRLWAQDKPEDQESVSVLHSKRRKPV